jgi:16S rRNA G1207 methylase RsmC
MDIKCVFSFSLQLLSETFLILRRTEQGVMKNVHWSSRKVTVVLVRFKKNLNSLDRLSKNIQLSNFMQIHAVGTELFHANGRTDGQDEANSRFSKFCESAQKLQRGWCYCKSG